MRPPDTPFKVCPRCGAESTEPWTNPVLVAMREAGLYAGAVQGGRVVCPLCAPAVKAEAAAATGKGVPTIPGMPHAFREAELGHFQTKDRIGHARALAAVKGLLKPDVLNTIGAGTDLYLYGTPGTGKSMLAAILLNEVHRRKLSTMFVRVPRLLDRLRMAMHAEELMADVLKDLETAYHVRFLVLDDVGADVGTDFARRQLHTLYEARLDVGLRTVWTSNMDLDALTDFFGDERLTSRIIGACSAAGVFELGGADQRIAGSHAD